MKKMKFTFIVAAILAASPILAQDRGQVEQQRLNSDSISVVPQLELSNPDFMSAISLGGNRVTNAGDPVNPDDAATKGYVDDLKDEILTATSRELTQSNGDVGQSNDFLKAVCDQENKKTGLFVTKACTGYKPELSNAQPEYSDEFKEGYIRGSEGLNYAGFYDKYSGKDGADYMKGSFQGAVHRYYFDIK